MSGDVEYEKALNKVRVIRWTSIIVYILLICGISILPIMVEMDLILAIVLNLIVTFGGLAVLIGILLYVHKMLPKRPDPSDRGRPIRKLRHLPPTYQEEHHLWLMYMICVPIVGLLAVIGILIPDLITRLIMAASIVFLVVIMVMFSRMTIVLSHDKMSMKFGPIGKTFPIRSIDSIKVVPIDWWKDYMGQGYRIGPDGSKGFIMGTKQGIRMTLDDGQVFVVSAKKPQYIVDYVRTARDSYL